MNKRTKYETLAAYYIAALETSENAREAYEKAERYYHFRHGTRAYKNHHVFRTLVSRHGLKIAKNKTPLPGQSN